MTKGLIWVCVLSWVHGVVIRDFDSYSVRGAFACKVTQNNSSGQSQSFSGTCEIQDMSDDELAQIAGDDASLVQTGFGNIMFRLNSGNVITNTVLVFPITSVTIFGRNYPLDREHNCIIDTKYRKKLRLLVLAVFRKRITGSSHG